MSFKFYKFCQNPIITILMSVFAVTSFVSNISNIPLWLCVIIGILVTVFSFFPIISFFYPLTISAYIVAAIVTSYANNKILMYLWICVLILHIVRFVPMLLLARKDPETSLIYDEAIRNGYKL